MARGRGRGRERVEGPRRARRRPRRVVLGERVERQEPGRREHERERRGRRAGVGRRLRVARRRGPRRAARQREARDERLDLVAVRGRDAGRLAAEERLVDGLVHVPAPGLVRVRADDAHVAAQVAGDEGQRVAVGGDVEAVGRTGRLAVEERDDLVLGERRGGPRGDGVHGRARERVVVPGGVAVPDEDVARVEPGDGVRAPRRAVLEVRRRQATRRAVGLDEGEPALRRDGAAARGRVEGHGERAAGQGRAGAGRDVDDDAAAAGRRRGDARAVGAARAVDDGPAAVEGIEEPQRVARLDGVAAQLRADARGDDVAAGAGDGAHRAAQVGRARARRGRAAAALARALARGARLVLGPARRLEVPQREARELAADAGDDDAVALQKGEAVPAERRLEVRILCRADGHVAEERDAHVVVGHGALSKRAAHAPPRRGPRQSEAIEHGTVRQAPRRQRLRRPGAAASRTPGAAPS